MDASDARHALAQLSGLCLALPEATREDAGRHAIFRVRARAFAYFQDDHHGDGMVTLVCKLEPGSNAGLVQSDPRRFHLPAYGRRGWIGLRLDVNPVDWTEVGELVVESYLLVAPRRLAALIDLPKR